MFTMLQECMKSTLEKVIEERPEIKTAVKEKNGTQNGGAKDVRAERSTGSANQSNAANWSETANPRDVMQMGEGGIGRAHV